MPRKSSGFTLIEVMVVVAIVAILAAIALPAYQDYVMRSRRADAQAVLQAAQLAQEKFRLNNTSYAATADIVLAANAPYFGRVCIISGGYCMSPSQFYRLTATVGTGVAASSDFTLTATAVGTQARDTSCAAITLTQTASGVTYGPNGCWRR